MRYFDQVLQAISFMESRLREEVSVTDVSIQAELSSWHFQRIFREYTGETIGSYLRRRRLASASEDLKSSDRKVIDIAIEHQFGSSEAFSRAFKTEFGLSPQQFRDAPTQLHLFKKLELKFHQLKYLAYEMELEPEIKIIEPILVSGLRVSFASPLSQPLQYMDAITDVWKRFVKRENEIKNQIGAIKVGLIEGLSSIHHPHDDIMDYLACTPVARQNLHQADFENAVIPGGKYAVFRATGFHEQTQNMIDHVYSTWLPNSSYQRAAGAEFTWLDHRLEPLNPITSKIDYYLPLA